MPTHVAAYGPMAKWQCIVASRLTDASISMMPDRHHLPNDDMATHAAHRAYAQAPHIGCVDAQGCSGVAGRAMTSTHTHEALSVSIGLEHN